MPCDIVGVISNREGKYFWGPSIGSLREPVRAEALTYQAQGEHSMLVPALDAIQNGKLIFIGGIR